MPTIMKTKVRQVAGIRLFAANNAAEDAIRPIIVGRKNWLLRGLAASRRACGGGAEPDRVGRAQWARSLGLSEGRIRAAAHAQQRDLASLLPHNWRSAAPGDTAASAPTLAAFA